MAEPNADDDNVDELLPLSELLLEKTDDINARDEFQRTALINACMNGDTTKAISLIKHGASIDEIDTYQTTALHYACRKGLDTVVQRLLKMGMDPNVKDYISDTPLIFACMAGHSSIAKSLINRGVSLDEGKWNRTPLLHACKQGLDEIVDILLKKGGNDLHAKDDTRNTAFHYACKVKTGPVCLLLLLKQWAKSYAEQCCSDSELAIDTHTKIVEFLNQCVADVEDDNYTAYTIDKEDHVTGFLKEMQRLINSPDSGLFGKAIKSGNLKTCKLLCRFGADLNPEENGDQPSLFIAAAKSNKVNVLKWLLAISPNTSDDDKGNALLEACRKHAYNTAEFLLKSGVNVDFQNEERESALLAACNQNKEDGEYGRADLAKLLIEHGANPNLITNVGLNAALVSMWDCNCYNDFLKILVDAGADLDMVLYIHGTPYTVLTQAFSNAECGDDCEESIKILSESGKLFLPNGKLKPCHCLPVHYYDCTEWTSYALKYGIFDWKLLPEDELFTFIGVAMEWGICPGRTLTEEGEYISPFISAFNCCLEWGEEYNDTAQQMIDTLYLLPDDYKDVKSKYHSLANVDNVEIFREFITQPLRLEALSFLAVSEAISLSGNPVKRKERVDALPIPSVLKGSLKFETAINAADYDEDCDENDNDDWEDQDENGEDNENGDSGDN